MTRRLLFVCVALLALAAMSRGEGAYQRTRNGKTLVWNNFHTSGDEATWSGRRDREGYARGYGTLVWYTKETGSSKPALYARYWGRMVGGKFDGSVNVHSKKKTHYAIFIDGARMTHWSAGTAPSEASARWRVAFAKQQIKPSLSERTDGNEPEAPGEGPSSFRRHAAYGQGLGTPEEDEDQWSELHESIQDLTRERWPMIDIDDSLRLLVWPPRSLRRR